MDFSQILQLIKTNSELAATFDNQKNYQAAIFYYSEAVRKIYYNKSTLSIII